jgi:ATP-dependent helicase HepA
VKTFYQGQRWISGPEPELGVGVVLDAAPGRVTLFFRASNTLRQYAAESAPLKRVEFRPGDTIRIHTGESLSVERVEGNAGDGLLVYIAKDREIPETDLSDTLSFSRPEERLLAGQVDGAEDFDLRVECLRRRHQIRHAPARGFIGARIALIPHQLSIAHDVASRIAPRVLLADEVGLGKTIEACLVVHRLFRSGRAGRILILVPEALVHQWFVELLRRFAMRVAIFDEERCRAVEAGEPGANPFLDDQVILCPISLLSGEGDRARQAAEAGWDLVVVDEAHHLAWSPGRPSAEYAAVESLAARSPGLILLTATPDQLGADGHFARLRLLDPGRYDDIARFAAERASYQATAKLAAKLLAGKPLTAGDRKSLRQICRANPDRLDARVEAAAMGDADARGALVRELVDQHGPGRVIFRNARARMKGFPARKVFLHPLAAGTLKNEWVADRDGGRRPYALADDPRVDWLAGFLRDNPDDKVLLICRTREKALALDGALRARANLATALFHEELTLIQRDRNAAWFAETGGARILLCSEIGSEGRNFQFARHLVLFDLPDDPDLLEQRIGRLDRIGRHEAVLIHVPYPAGSHLDILAGWYHRGLNAFASPLEGGREVMDRFGGELAAFLQKPEKPGFDALLDRARTFHAGLAKELARGQDVLLRMNSCRPETAERIIAQIGAFDRDAGLDEFVLRMFDRYGVRAEEIAPRTWIAKPGPLATDAIPGLPESGLALTADRAKALAREEIEFLTWDHPLVGGAIDLLLGSVLGTASFAIWPGGEGIFLEAVFTIEPVAPPALHLDRFLPSTPVRVVVDTASRDVSGEVELSSADLLPGSIFPILDNARIKHKILPAMLDACRRLASARAALVASQASQKMRSVLGLESERLRDLKKSNPHIRDEEITALDAQAGELDTRIAEAPLRLDAVRLIWRTPSAGSAR